MAGWQCSGPSAAQHWSSCSATTNTALLGSCCSCCSKKPARQWVEDDARLPLSLLRRTGASSAPFLLPAALPRRAAGAAHANAACSCRCSAGELTAGKRTYICTKGRHATGAAKPKRSSKSVERASVSRAGPTSPKCCCAAAKAAARRHKSATAAGRSSCGQHERSVVRSNNIAASLKITPCLATYLIHAWTSAMTQHHGCHRHSVPQRRYGSCLLLSCTKIHSNVVQRRSQPGQLLGFYHTRGGWRF
jgi:hypothetical protein